MVKKVGTCKRKKYKNENLKCSYTIDKTKTTNFQYIKVEGRKQNGSISFYILYPLTTFSLSPIDWYKVKSM